jgi:hypothetical protein
VRAPSASTRRLTAWNQIGKRAPRIEISVAHLLQPSVHGFRLGASLDGDRGMLDCGATIQGRRAAAAGKGRLRKAERRGRGLVVVEELAP